MNKSAHLGQNVQKETTAFAERLASVFQPFPSQLQVMEEETINDDLNNPHQMVLSMKEMRIKYVKKSCNIKSIQKRLRAKT